MNGTGTTGLNAILCDEAALSAANDQTTQPVTPTWSSKKRSIHKPTKIIRQGVVYSAGPWQDVLAGCRLASLIWHTDILPGSVAPRRPEVVRRQAEVLRSRALCMPARDFPLASPASGEDDPVVGENNPAAAERRLAAGSASGRRL